jgi:hypothetical protein
MPMVVTFIGSLVQASENLDGPPFVVVSLQTFPPPSGLRRFEPVDFSWISASPVTSAHFRVIIGLPRAPELRLFFLRER